MPDFERLNQIHQLAILLRSMPPQKPGGPRIPLPAPKLAQWATELVDKFGVRVHPELGSMELIVDPVGDERAGSLRPQRMVPRIDAGLLLTLLRDTADKTGVADLAELADRIEAANTDDERKAVIADIDRENPGLIATARKHFDAADPETVFGQ